MLNHIPGATMIERKPTSSKRISHWNHINVCPTAILEKEKRLFQIFVKLIKIKTIN